jgi:methyl-accepting chemotaxis protein
MSEITPEKTHQLLEKLADYVMNEVPKKSEVASKEELGAVRQELKTDSDELRQDMQNIKGSLNTLLDGMDKQVQQLDMIRTEQVSFNQAFKRVETRVEKLEKVH